MDVIRHYHVATNEPEAGSVPSLAQQNVSTLIGEAPLTPLRDNGDEHDDRTVPRAKGMRWIGRLRPAIGGTRSCAFPDFLG